MPDPVVEENSTNEAFKSSPSFLATMDAVTSGEKDPEKLSQVALDADPMKPDGEQPEQTPEEKAAAEEAAAAAAAAAEEDGAKTPEEEAAAAAEEDDKKDKTVEELETDKDKGQQSREELRQKLAAEKATETEGKPDDKDDELRGHQPADSTRFRKRVDNYEKLLAQKDEAIAAVQTELEAVKTKVGEFEKKGATLPENVTEELAELKQFRRRYSLERDPEFQKRFQDKLDESNELVDDALVTVGVSEKLRKEIKDSGGVGNWMRTGANVKMIVDKKEVDHTPSEFVSKVLGLMKDGAPDSEAVLRAELATQRRIEKEKSKFIEAESAEAEKFFKDREDREEQIIAAGAKVEEELEKVITTFKGTVHTNEWLKDLEIPADATEEQTKALKDDNQFRKDLRTLFDSQLEMPMVREAAKRTTSEEESKEFANILIDSARVFHVERELRAKTEQVKALEEELKSVRKAGSRSTPRKTTGARVNVDTSGEPKREDFSSNLQFAVAMQRWEAAQGKQPAAT